MGTNIQTYKQTKTTYDSVPDVVGEESVLTLHHEPLKKKKSKEIHIEIGLK